MGVRRSESASLVDTVATDPSPHRRWVSATLLIAFALAGCGSPRASQSEGAIKSAAVPSQSDAASPAASPSASGAVGFGELELGDAVEIACGETGPIFSPSGELVACGTDLFEWPAMGNVAVLEGRPLSWGELDGVESLLLDIGQGSLAVIDAGGTRRTVDTEGLEGSVVGTWAPSGDAVWLQSGMQTGQLRLDSWTRAGREPLVSTPNAISATNITASPDTRWVAIFNRGCSPSGCTFSLDLVDESTSGATTVAFNMPGTLGDVWVTEIGDVLFAVDGGSGRVDLWRARQGESPAIWFPQVSVWPLSRDRIALAGAGGAFIIDLATGAEQPLGLPAETQASDVLSISGDSEWIAISTDESSVVLMPVVDGTDRRFEVPVPNLDALSVRWTGNPDYVVFHTGPPFTSTVIRLGD